MKFRNEKLELLKGNNSINSNQSRNNNFIKAVDIVTQNWEIMDLVKALKMFHCMTNKVL